MSGSQGALAEKNAVVALIGGKLMAGLILTYLNQFEERKTNLREGPRTGESWGDSGGNRNRILGASSPNISLYLSPSIPSKIPQSCYIDPGLPIPPPLQSRVYEFKRSLLC